MKKILLFGATGFLGLNLIKKLEQEHEVKIMIHKSELISKIPKFKGDILEKESFIKEIDSDDIIVNLVGQISNSDDDLINSNILGAINLLTSCVEKNVKRIILISSINVYGENQKSPSMEYDKLNPLTNYGIVKMITEKIYQNFSKNFNLSITVIRLSGIYGPDKKIGFLSQLINSIENKSIIPKLYNNGNQQRDMLFVSDAINGIYKAIQYEHEGFEIFNISSGKRYSINQLINKIEKITNLPIDVEYISEIKDERCIWANYNKAKKFLNFEPLIDIDSGLRKLFVESKD